MVAQSLVIYGLSSVLRIVQAESHIHNNSHITIATYISICCGKGLLAEALVPWFMPAKIIARKLAKMAISEIL